MASKSVAAIVVAAGSGTRMRGIGGGTPKAFLPLLGVPMYRHSLDVLERSPAVDLMVLVVPEPLVASARERAGGYAKLAAVVAGGETRQASVSAGLRALGADVAHVLVHDAARPCLTAGIVERVVCALDGAEAVVPAVPVADTIKQVDGEGRVVATPERSSLRAVQTPQGFRIELLRRAHAEARGDATDDAALVEALGIPVFAVEGEPTNLKVTTPEDLARAEAILRDAAGQSGVARPEGADSQRRSVGEGADGMLVGFGYDVHRLVPGRRLVLGGVEIPFEMGLEGHSDADVIAHAVMDALLGAASLGDIGRHFPPSDPAWRGADSVKLMQRVRELLAARGYHPVNVDATLIAERPKIAPYAEIMRARMAAALGLPPERVSVKATTNEGLGTIGRNEGIAAVAVAHIRRYNGAG